MKNFSFTVISIATIVLASCQMTEQRNVTPPPESPITPVVTELQSQTAPYAPREIDRPPVKTEENTVLYRGSWFDIEYPKDFTARPFLLDKFNGIEYTETDEAYFVSPDNSVEFYVFSPIWTGEPEYLTITATEEIVSEKTANNKTEYGTRTTRWVTIKAKDESYYRSFVSVKDHMGESETHHVFGVKYRDAESYMRYKNAYTAFKKSLRQYID